MSAGSASRPAAKAASASGASMDAAALDKFDKLKGLFGTHWVQLSAAEREAAATLYAVIGHHNFVGQIRWTTTSNIKNDIRELVPPRTALSSGTALPTPAEAAAFRDFAKTLPAAMAAGKMGDGSAWPTQRPGPIDQGDLLDDVLDIVAEVCQTPLFWIILVIAIVAGVYMSLPPPPAKIVLVMLAKDSAASLERNLPLWGRLVDYAVIGIDGRSTDNSWGAVSRALQGIPHHIQEVTEFEGYGPALTPLVEKALALFPDASVGMLVEPDWRPDPRSLQGWNNTRRSMAVRTGNCPLFRFHVVTKEQPHSGNAVPSQSLREGLGGSSLSRFGVGGPARQLDWVYANIEGVTVQRRAHQQVSVPWRGRYQTESSATDDCDLDVLIQEDRHWEPRGLPMEKSLKKRLVEENNACLKLLEKDFLEDPSEPRTLYHLGLHYKTAHEQHKDSASAEAMELLNNSHHYLHLRARIDERGDAQERWWATVLLGYIHLYAPAAVGGKVKDGTDSAGRLAEAGKWLKRAVTLDATRQEPYAMLAERYVAGGQYDKALSYRLTAAQLPIPGALTLRRSMLDSDRQQYECYAPLQHGLLAADMKKKGVELSDENVDAAKDSLRRAQEGCGARAMREVVLAQQTLG